MNQPNNDVAVWIDYNQDGIFQEPAEKLGQVDNIGADPAVATINFTVPIGAFNGATRMRVREADQGAQIPACGGLSFGEVEDYTITITGGVDPTAITYLWSPGTFLTSTSIANPVAESPTTTTAYSVLVTGTNGCTSTGNVTLTVNQSPDVALALVDNCIASQFSISVNVNSTGNGPTVDLSYTVNGGAPTVVSGLGVGVQTPLGPFAQLDEVVVTIVDPAGGCNSTLPLFRSACPEVVTCGTTLVKNYCYGNNDTRSWVFTTSNGIDPVRIDFISGAMAPGDVIRAYDGTDNTGTPLLGLTGNFIDLAGAFELSFGPNLYLEVESDGSGSCADADPAASAWVFNVRCNPPCTDPNAFVTPLPNCVDQTFTIDVDVYDLGSGIDPTNSVDLEYTVNGGQPDTIPGITFGITTIGPFDLGASINVRLLHEYDAACNKNLGTFTLGQAACPNDEQCSAWILTMNPNYTCASTRTGDMSTATLTAGITSTCAGITQDLWYRFTATATTHRIVIGGTTTGLTHSLYVGSPDCNTLTQVGTSCTAGATASNPTGLTIGETYYVRVSRTTAGTNAFTVCVSAPPLIDVDATVLVEPLATGCFSAAEDVIVTVLNNSIYPLDLSVDPLTVTVNVTGATTATLTGTLNTGVVAPAATVNVTMSTTLNMSVGGAYTFNGSASVAGDGNAANDAMTAATRTVVAATALPISQNFTGFSGSNLATLVAPNNGWREGAGAALPAGTTSTWTSSLSVQQTQLGTGVSARVNFTTAARNEWIVSPKFIPVVGTQLAYSIAITETGAAGIDAAGMQANDQVIIKVSTDCGVTFNQVALHGAGNTVGITNSLVAQLVDLSAYAGQEVIVAFHATKPTSATHPSYDFHLDNITIQNVTPCAGVPVAGTASITVPGPACSPASTGLNVTGQSTAGGVSVKWLSSTTPGGPYTAVAGNGTSISLAGITSTTYYVASVTCLITLDSTLTNEVAIQITPTPTASASAGLACTGQDLQLTGTTDIGTSYSWSGPGGFTSTEQNPVRPAITTAAGGTYTFTATANGCPTSGTVSVSVNNTPVVLGVTGDPNPVCLNGNSQLNANVSLAGNVTTYSFASSPGTFNTIFGQPGTVEINTGADDTSYGPYALGFTFNYGGTDYTTAGVNANGFVAMGASPTSSSTSLSTGTTNNVIAAFNEDLEGDPLNGGTMLYQVTGAPGSQVFTFEWRNWGFWSLGANEISFQVKLYEGTNVIQFVYQNGTGTAGDPVQVGLRGASNAVFNNRTTTTDWSNTTAGAVNNALCTFSGAVRPANGLTFTWTPPSVASYSWTPNTYLTADNIANPVAQNVAADITYTVTATAASGCVSAPAQLLLEANPALLPGEAEILPATPSFCTGSNVTLTANPLGGGAPYTYAWTDPSSNPAGTDATQVVNVPGTWSVTITDNCGGSASASIVVNEFPVPVVTANSSSPACTGAPINFTATSTVVGSTFAWSGPGGFTSTSQDPAIPSAVLTNSGTYSVIASANGCSSPAASTTVTVNTTPSAPVIEPTVWSLCPGGSVDLEATSGASGTGTIGTGTIQNTTTSYPTPYGAFYESVRTQFLLLPADLTAMGAIPGGTLNSIGFFVANLGTSGVHTNYTIRMGNTAATSLSTAAWVTVPGAPVFGPVNYQPVNGLNTHVLTTPFVWTGGSVVVDICHSNDPTGTGGILYTENAVVNATATAVTTSTWRNSDNVENCLTANLPTGSSLTRPNMTFGYSFTPTLVWSPGTGLNTTTGATVTASPSTTTTYTVTADNNGCSASEDVIVYIGTNELTLEVETDANAAQTSWEIIQQGSNEVIFAGGGLPSNATVTQFSCLPDGCYRLRVLDAGGDGIAGGGYILRTNAGDRIIDNRDNFTNGSVSAVIGNGGFCLPLGTDKLIYTSCDKLDWVNNQFIVAAENPAVSLQWQDG